MDSTEVIDSLARKAYDAVRGENNPTTFDELPAAFREQYRVVAGAVLDGMTPHVTALMHAFGTRALAAESKVAALTQQLHETREWALELDTANNNAVDLLTKATPFVQQAKWQGDLTALRLLEAIEKEAHERLARLPKADA